MTAFALKLIALVTMIIDHTGAVFQSTPGWLRWIGRIAFPIYVFLIAEGARLTKSMPKYLFRLGLFALLSEIPFDLAFHTEAASISQFGVFRLVDFLNDTNVYYTLFLAVLAIYVIQLMKNKPFRIPVAAVALGSAAFIAEFLGTDYGSFGVVWIVCAYLPEKRSMRLGMIAGGIVFFYLQIGDLLTALYYMIVGNTPMFEYTLSSYSYSFSFWLPMFLFAMLALIPLTLYNGKRGRSFKWLFYALYPLHILILVLIRQTIGG